MARRSLALPGGDAPEIVEVTSDYLVKSPLRFNGKRYEIDATIALTEAEALKLGEIVEPAPAENDAAKE